MLDRTADLKKIWIGMWYNKYMPEVIHPEIYEKKKFGADVKIRNFWIRHAQKMSGEIVNAEKTSLSYSTISPKGEKESKAYGEKITAGKHGAKGYVSESMRTTQTLEKVLDGYQSANPDIPIRKLRIREELTSEFPNDFLHLYDEKFGKEKERILKEAHLSKEVFAKLSSDEQEKIAEKAEEPVAREWIDNPKSNLSKLYSPREAAARFSVLFAKRHDGLARKLYSGSDIDLFHVTHKTITEPFLASGVLVRKSNDERVNTIEQLGGTLGTLGDWESEVRTDEKGESNIIIRIRGEEFKVDNDVLNILVKEGLNYKKDK